MGRVEIFDNTLNEKIEMGKTITQIKLWNIFDEEKIEKGEMSPIEVDAQIDNGAVKLILPQSISR